MKISSKLSIAFLIAGVFLLGVGVAGVQVIDRLERVLTETTTYNQQLDQVSEALRAVRLSPNRTADHLARLDDLQKQAGTDEERKLLREARAEVAQGQSLTAATGKLEQLSAYYCQAMATAHKQLLTMHHRIVVGIIIVIVDSILMFLLLTWLVRYWLLHPVRDLGESIAILARGELDHRIKSNAGREFDQIAESLNTLSGKLRTLEQRVEEAEKYSILGQACTHVTHNIRSLLNSIRSLAQYESNVTDADHGSRVGFNYIIASVNKLDVWVRDLISSVAPQNPNRAPHQIEPVIHDALLLLQPRLTERNLTIDYQAPDELPAVIMDRALFEQAFVAVITNAIEASPDDGHIGVLLRNGDGDRVTVQIKDEGGGMSEVTRAHAFEAFFTTKPDSVGLGLTLAHTIVQRHGGDIQIQNGPEKGTSVMIHLPSVKKNGAPGH